VNSLATHRAANKSFFASGQGPSKATWVDWVERDVVKGVVIDKMPYIDLNWFAVNKRMEAPEVVSDYDQVLELLTG